MSYSVHNYQAGEVIRSADLNEMDAQIAANETAAANAQSTADDAVPKTTKVNGHALSGDVSVTATDVGLGNVDNTSDANKPISTATQAALDGKVPTTRKVNGHALSSDVTVTKGDVGLGNVDNVQQVPATRKVNNKALSSDVTLYGSDIPMNSLDGTKLDTAVSDLKSALNNILYGTAVPIQFTQTGIGYISDSDNRILLGYTPGDSGNNQIMVINDLSQFNLSVGDVLSLHLGNSTQKYAIGFSNVQINGNTFLTSAEQFTVQNDAETIEIVIPNNTVAICIFNRYTILNSPTIEKESDSILNSAKSYTNEKIEPFENNVVDISEFMANDGFIYTDYSVISTQEWRYSDYFDVDNISGELMCTFIGHSNVYNISFYTENKDPNGYVKTTGQNNAEYTTKAQIPSNTKYIRVCDTADHISNGRAKVLFHFSEQKDFFETIGSPPELTNKSTFIVDKNGNGDFSTINEAVSKISTDTAEHPITLIINPGTYKEKVDIDSSRYLSLVGVNRNECIIRWDTGAYRNEPLIFEGSGVVENLTIISTYDDVENPDPTQLYAYAVHVDDRQRVANRKQTFRNCVLSSNTSAAIGIGLHQGETVELINCFLYSHTINASDYRLMGALFCHSGSGENITGQKLIVKDCVMISDNAKTIAITDELNTGGGEMEVTFINNMAYCYNPDGNIVRRTTPTGEGKFSGQGISLSPMSYGNNIAIINK